MPFRHDGYERSRRRWYLDCKTGTRAWLAGYAYLSSMLLHYLLDDGEADSGARFAGFLRFFRAIKLLEDQLGFLLIHSDALIFHGDPDMSPVLPDGNRHLGPLGRVLNCVRK